jgi:CDP-4-dehydro-6-deoxyglucose reductase
VTLVLLEPIAENQWKGKTGSIHQAVMEDYRDLSGYQVYACAGPEIVEGAKRDFVALRGLPEEAFFFEDYGHGKNPALPEPVTPPDSLP